MTLCITNPLWVTKTRLMLQYGGVVNPSQRQYTGMFDALVKIYKYEGVRGLYKVTNYHECTLSNWKLQLILALFSFCFVFETKSCHIAQSGLQLSTFLSKTIEY